MPTEDLRTQREPLEAPEGTRKSLAGFWSAFLDALDAELAKATTFSESLTGEDAGRERVSAPEDGEFDEEWTRG